MKALLEKTIAALMRADLACEGGLADSAPAGVDSVKIMRRLQTRLGPIHIPLPAPSSAARLARNVDRLLERYPMAEISLLLLLGRIVVRGQASAETVRDMAQLLCRSCIDAATIANAVRAIDEELDQYLRRELERGYFEEPGHNRLDREPAHP